MAYEYMIYYSADYKPDTALTQMNELASEGWRLQQIGQSKWPQSKIQWFYLLSRETAPVEPSPESNIQVSGAGYTECNGHYTYQNPDTWEADNFSLTIIRQDSYPTPGVNSWTIIDNSSRAYYEADDTPYPWDAVWRVSSFGTAPIPTVQAAT